MSNATQKQIWSAGARARKDVMDRYLTPLWTGLLDATGATRGKKLLDAGCGSGELCAIALARGCEVTGLDYAPQMIELCRADPKLTVATFVEGTIEHLPFETHTFDAVIASMSVHFCDDVPAAIAEMFRVLALGGRAGISAPLTLDLDVLIAFHLAIEMVPQEAETIGRPLTFAPDGKLAESLAHAGFVEIQERTLDTPLVANSFAELWEIQKKWAPIQLASDLVGEAAFLAAYQARLEARLGTASPSTLGMSYRLVTGVRA